MRDLYVFQAPTQRNVSVLMYITNHHSNPLQYPSGFHPGPLSYHYKPHVLSARFNPRWAWHKLPWSVCRLSISLFTHTPSLFSSQAIYKRMITKETTPQHMTSILSIGQCYRYNNCLQRASVSTCLLACHHLRIALMRTQIINQFFVTLHYILELLFVHWWYKHTPTKLNTVQCCAVH